MASILGWLGCPLGGPPGPPRPPAMLAWLDMAADMAAWAAALLPASDMRCSWRDRPRDWAMDTAGPRSRGPMPRAPARPPGMPGIPPGIPGGAPPGN